MRSLFTRKIDLVFLHLPYTLIEKQPYLVSTSSYNLSVKSFYSHVHPILMVFKNSHETKWWIVKKHYATIILVNPTMWSSSPHKQCIPLCTTTFISKESLFYTLSFRLLRANILWYVISSKSAIHTHTHTHTHTQHT